MGILRLKVLHLLHLFTAPLTVTCIKNHLEKNDTPVHRKTISTILYEISEYPTPGYELHYKMVRSGKTKCEAYLLTKIKHTTV